MSVEVFELPPEAGQAQSVVILAIDNYLSLLLACDNGLWRFPLPGGPLEKVPADAEISTTDAAVIKLRDVSGTAPIPPAPAPVQLPDFMAMPVPLPGVAE